MRVAVTGAAGLLGRSAVPLLTEQGHEVVALGRDQARLEARCSGAACCRATAYGVPELREAFEGCRAVLHLAARRMAPPGEGPEAFVGPNLELTGRVLQGAAAAGVEVVCLASSISVYSAVNDVPYSEAQEPRPAGPYGQSKLAAERLGREWAAASGRRIVALRFASLLGPEDQTAADRMLTVFLDRARRGEPLVIWGEGEGGRDVLYARDAARAAVAALSPEAPGGVFNIGSGRPHSVREIAAAMNEVFANPAGMQFDRSRLADPTVAFMDCRQAAAHLGWMPRWSLRAALEDMRDRGDLPMPAGGG